MEDELKNKVEAAQTAVKDLEEPLKTKAFEIILNKLLSTNTETHTTGHQSLTKSNVHEDEGDRLSDDIDRTAYPVMYKLPNVLDKALYVLFIAKNYYGVDGLSPSQISKILTLKFRLPTTMNAIGMTLMKRGDFVDRSKIQTQGGTAYKYKIMHAGESHVKKILDNPPTEEVKIKKISKTSVENGSKKKRKDGLKEKIILLKDGGFFEKPKEVMEVKKELQLKGHSYDIKPVGTALLRLVKKGNLKRIIEMKEQKSIYKYCNI